MLRLRFKTVSWISLSLCLLLCLISLNGCASSPESKPKMGQPPIPPTINKGEGVEPELLVYLADKKKVQSMHMEEYIQGVVAGEMAPDWPDNALAAQAILARTFTLQKIAEKDKLENRDAHASTDIKEFQAYDAEKINARIEKAVESTRGQVITHQGNFIRAWFHAYSGGETTTAEEGLGFTQEATPYIQPVNDAGFDASIPEEVRFWTATFPLSEIRAAAKKVTGQDPGPVKQIMVSQSAPSGRVSLLRVNQTEVAGNAFRLALDSTVLKSTLISEVKIKDGKAIFKGKGYGHGVGMSQWGARVMAEQGRTPEQIALNYFRDCQIVKLW